jgi:hypothetical protein
MTSEPIYLNIFISLSFYKEKQLAPLQENSKSIRDETLVDKAQAIIDN